MISKNIVTKLHPDAKAVKVYTRNSKVWSFPLKMTRSAPRNHFLRKKFPRYKKGKINRYVVVGSGEKWLSGMYSTKLGAWCNAAQNLKVENLN